MPTISDTVLGEKYLLEFYDELSKNKLLHLTHHVAVKRALFLSVFGLPTHHSKFISFQRPSSSIMEGIVDLHNDIMVFQVFIIVFVLYLLAASVLIQPVNKYNDNQRNIHGYSNDSITHNSAIEVI
jgi:heme/copper-type cytochrome/quinol oxidase subunit 2